MNGYNCEPITTEWLMSCGEMKNARIEVRPIAIYEHYDAIELWECSTNEDGRRDRCLVAHWFPITKGDVRTLCAALAVPCNG